MQKAFDKIQHPFIIKTLNKMDLEVPRHNKAHIWKLSANIVLNGKNLKAFCLSSGARQRCLLSPLLMRIVLEVLARAIKQDKEIKGIKIQNKEVKLSLFSDNIILYKNTPKTLPKNY